MWNRGLAYALFAFGFWGISPLYWALFTNIFPFDTAVFRMLGSALVMGLILALKRYHPLWRALKWQHLAMLSVSGALLTANWWIYIWAIKASRVLECSLGYYINPIFSVLLGSLFLGEKLVGLRPLAVAASALGVASMTYGLGQLPLVSLGLAASFGSYGVLKKKIPLSPLFAFGVEALCMMPFALMASSFIEWPHYVINATWFDYGLIASAGIVTAIPLIAYNKAADLIPLSTLGMIQFTTPTLKFLIGILFFNETMDFAKGLGFGFIWLGVALFMWPVGKATGNKSSG